MSEQQNGVSPATAGGAPLPETIRRRIWVAAEDLANAIGCTLVVGAPGSYPPGETPYAHQPDQRDVEIERLRSLLREVAAERDRMTVELEQVVTNDRLLTMLADAEADRDVAQANERDLRRRLARIKQEASDWGTEPETPHGTPAQP